MSIQLNGFELHIYNRTSTYKELEKKFGIFTGLFTHDEETEDPGHESKEQQQNSSATSTSSSNFLLGKNWRDLIPVVKVSF